MMMKTNNIERITMLVLLAFIGWGTALADEWSIDFSEIGTTYSLADKATATVSDVVSDGMGTVTLGEALNSNFGMQAPGKNSYYMYRTATKGLYLSTGGARSFGVFNATEKQIITLNSSVEPTTVTNATLKGTEGNVRFYEVTADGTVKFSIARYSTLYSIAISNYAEVYSYKVHYVDADGNKLLDDKTGAYKVGGDDVTTYYPQNIIKEGTLYSIKANATGNYFGVTFTPDKDNYEVSVTYDNPTVENVAYYTEIENISGVTAADFTSRASNAKIGHTADADTYVDATTLPAGNYRIYWRGINGNSVARSAKVKVGDKTYSFEIAANSTNVTGTSLVMNVPTDGTAVSIACEGSSLSGLDWIYFVKSESQVTYASASVSDILEHKAVAFTVDAACEMSIDGGDKQTAVVGNTYYAKTGVETWTAAGIYKKYSTGYEDKPFAVWVYQDGYTNAGVTPDGEGITAILDGLKEQYNVLSVHGDGTEAISTLCPNIAKADLVVLSEMVSEGVLSNSFKNDVLGKTNFLNFKLPQYQDATNCWGWTETVDVLPNTLLSVKTKDKLLKVLDGVTFNEDDVYSLNLWTLDAESKDHLYAVGSWSDAAPSELNVSGNTLLTAKSTSGAEESVLHFYNINNKVYVGFGLSVNDYTHYNDNVKTIVSNIGRMIEAGTPLNESVTSLDAPVIADNGDGSAAITSSIKMATVYYSTTNTTADAIISEGVTTSDGITKKFNSSATEITVYAVASLNAISSPVAQKSIAINNNRTVTRTIAANEAEGADVVMTYKAGETITVPYNQSFKKDGYSVRKWIDRSTGTEYIPGQSMTIDQDIVLEAVWSANTKKITDLKGGEGENRKAVFQFLHKNGAASMTGSTGVLVGQVRFSATEGDFIDVVCQYEIGHSATCPTDNASYDGKFNNAQTNSIDWATGDTEEYAQVKAGTMFTFPAVYGMTVNYKPLDLDQDNRTSVHRTYVSFSQLKDGKLDNPAFTSAQAAASPVRGSFTDNYEQEGNFSYTGNDATAEFTSIESAVVYTGKAGQAKSTVIGSGSLGWNDGSGFFESLSVTYPILYTVTASVNNITADISSAKAATATLTDVPGNTDGKYPSGMSLEMKVTPAYPYVYYYTEGLTDDEVANIHYNYTRNGENPAGEYNYTDVVDETTGIDYGGTATFTVDSDKTVTAYVKLITSFEIQTSASPFRSGIVNLPDNRTIFANNNLITLTVQPKVGYVFEKWIDENGKDITASATGSVRAIDNTSGTLSLLVTKESAAKTYVAQFKAGVNGTVEYDLTTVPAGTVTSGFPSSETTTTMLIPKYYTLYNNGQTLDHWVSTTDATKKYEIGTNYTFDTENETRSIKPVFKENTANFDYRTTEADITWDFRTAYYAQKMNFTAANTTVYYSTHASIDDPAITIDVPLVINTGSKGFIDNTNIDDWCTIGEGTTITIPSGLGATFVLASYSPITSTNIDGDTLTDYTLTKESGVNVYLYTYTTKSAATSVTLTIGDDYSYYKYIRAKLPSADKVELNISSNDKAMGSAVLATAKVSADDSAADAPTTATETGYKMPLGTYVTIKAYRNNLYEFDHWEDGDGNTLADGTDGYTIVKNDAGSVNPVTDVNASIKFQIKSYETDIKAVFKARAQYKVTFSEGSNATGVAPDAIVVEQGSTFTMPASNQTLFYSGHTLKYWQDADGNKYELGKSYAPTSNLTLTPVFQANEFTLVDIKVGESATATWKLSMDDGACSLNYHNANGIYVTQVTYQGMTIDDALTITSPNINAGLSNQGDSAYCTINTGVTIAVPTTPGCEITLDTYDKLQTQLTTTKIAGADSQTGTEYANAYTAGNTAAVTYNGEQGSQNIEFSGDAQAFSYISVTYHHINVALPEITAITYGENEISKNDVTTLNNNKSLSGISITPVNDELPLLKVTCSNDGVATITQPTIANPNASIALRTVGGILVATYEIGFNVVKPDDAPTLLSVKVDGKTATYTKTDTWTIDGTVSTNGVVELTFDRVMSAYTMVLNSNTYGIHQTLKSDGGSKTLTLEYFDMPNGLTNIPVVLSKSGMKDVYGNSCSTATGNYYYLVISTAASDVAVTPQLFNFVVTHDYDDSYDHSLKNTINKHQLVDTEVINRLKAAGIAYGTIDEGIAAANADKSGNRFYIFVPDGSYQLLGNTPFVVSSVTCTQNKDGETVSTGTSFDNGMTYLTRTDGMVSIIGQSQDGTVLWNDPYFYGQNITSTLEVRNGISDCYLQDVSLDNHYSKVKNGSPREGSAVAFLDGGYHTIMKNVSVLGYQNSFVSNLTSTADRNGSAYYEDCSFAGNTDFIQGNGNLWFENCNFQLRKGSDYNICSASNTANNKWGFVFNNCTIDADEDISSEVADKYSIGRPLANTPAVTYLNSQMNVLPTTDGWGKLTPNLKLRMREYNSVDASGSVLDLTSRSVSSASPASGSLDPVMTSADASEYTLRNVLGGGEAYNPAIYTAQRPAVKNAGFDDNILSWEKDDEALCYFIFRVSSENGEYKLYTITTETRVNFQNEEKATGCYIIRAANERGGLGEPTSPIEYTDPTRYTMKLSKVYSDEDKAIGWSTICLPFNAKVPVVDKDGDGKNDVIVYAAYRINNGALVLKKVDYITKNEGYIVYGLPAEYTFISSSHTSEEYNGLTTYLNGNPTDGQVSASSYNCYTLAYKPKASGIGFYKFTGSNLAAYKAWLDVSTFMYYNESSEDDDAESTAAKNGIRFIFDDDDIPDGIRSVNISTDNDRIYETNGVRVLKPVRGHINIIDGQKVLNK